MSKGNSGVYASGEKDFDKMSPEEKEIFLLQNTTRGEVVNFFQNSMNELLPKLYARLEAQRVAIVALQEREASFYNYLMEVGLPIVDGRMRFDPKELTEWAAKDMLKRQKMAALANAEALAKEAAKSGALQN